MKFEETMFNKSKSQAELLAAQSATLSVQVEAMKSQAALIASLERRVSALDRSNTELAKKVEDRESRINTLTGYLSDFGVNVNIIEGSGMWWSTAKKMIQLRVDENLVDEHMFAGDEQRAYASSLARSVIGQSRN